MTQRQKVLLDPLVTIPIPDWESNPTNGGLSRSSISSLCFLPPLLSLSSTRQDSTKNSKEETDADDNINDTIDDSSSDESDDDDGIIYRRLRCNQSVIPSEQSTGGARNIANNLSVLDTLRGCHILSCNLAGETWLWDIYKRKRIGNYLEGTNSRGPGLVLRRIYDNTANQDCNKCIYQTRDPLGTVSLHDLSTGKIIAEIQTKSRSFCAASPCIGGGGNDHPNLILTPDEDDTIVVIRDWRVASNNRPAFIFSATGVSHNNYYDSSIDSSSSSLRHGMITSMAFAATSSSSLIAACGLESGVLFFHDLTMPTKIYNVDVTSVRSSCNVKLGSDPILSLDLSASSYGSTASTASSQQFESVVAVAGTAGDQSDLAEKDINDRGTVAIVKATKRYDHKYGFNSTAFLQARIRSKFTTCNLDSIDETVLTNAKPGVGICRLSSDGKSFAVGGWDNRVRIFDRRSQMIKSDSGSLIAVLRGHRSSVNSIDWCPSQSDMNILATSGASDDKIHIWNI